MLHHDRLSALLLVDTNLLEKFPELEQKVDYFLHEWNQSSILLTSCEVTRQIHKKQGYYNRFLSINKRQKKSKFLKASLPIQKHLLKKLSEELETLTRSKNVLWRSWAVEKNGPGSKYPPEKINWNKDADLIFLYGPIYKHSIELPWSCRSPNVLLKGSLKSALKRTSPLSLIGTVSPPLYLNTTHHLDDSFISYNDYLTNQCMVVFRQEEELLPTDFEDIEDDEDSNSTIDTLNNHSDSEIYFPLINSETSQFHPDSWDSNLHYPIVEPSDSSSTLLSSQNITENTSSAIKFNHNSISTPSSAPSFLISKKLSSPKLSSSNKQSDAPCSSNTASANSGEPKSLDNSLKRKGRNRSTFVIKLASASLKDPSIFVEDSSSYTGLNLRKKFIRKKRAAKNANIPEHVLTNDELDSDSEPQVGWIWSTLGLASQKSKSSPVNETLNYNVNMPSPSSPPSNTSLSDTVQGLLSNNWNSIWVPSAELNSPTCTSPHLNLNFDQLIPSNYDVEIKNNSNNKNATPNPILSNSSAPSTPLSSQSHSTHKILNSDFAYSNSLSKSVITDNQISHERAQSSALWPTIKESSEVLLDNAEDRIATTVDAVKWLSSFFSNYNPF
ncbi:hypothetical protein BB561_004305 [Smittium simulii]|uniref:Uncharacterized protein n=1 Tax=Smittium simulii TaxID=133385 RepID=A0A2T9YGZ8_9FUNG|nr:hypothetical protein BB561_004305 [Smittium simulii]